MTKEQRRIRIGVLGCGPISQFAHLDACRKARNTDLHAICDVADELRQRMTAIHQPSQSYARYEEMLADAQVDAVLIAIADDFHVSAAREALLAGKHVLVEKPLASTVEDCQRLIDVAATTDRVVRVAHNRRFDPGMALAHRFVSDELGGRISIKAWYHDSTFRYVMTDNLQPPAVNNSQRLRPDPDPRSDLNRYFLLAHGSHLVDTAQFLGGPMRGLRARRIERAESHCWFVHVDFEDGGLGHLDLHVPVRGDFEEGFEIQGELGSVKGRACHPWYLKSSQVECFSVKDRQYRRVLGEDAHTYRLQIEDFAQSVLDGGPHLGADLEEGLAAVRALAAITRSVQTGEYVRLDEVTGGV